MTSGKFKSVLVDTIHINRDRRQRRELTNIEELAESISKRGLINPIVITGEGELVAGERRLTAIRSLGWTSVPVHYAEDLDETELQLIELEENTKRVDLDWRDQCAAVAKYHELRTKQDETWNMNKTAEELGATPNHLSRQMQVAQEIIAGNERVTEAPKFSVALGIVQRTNARKKASAKATLLAAVEEATPPEAKRKSPPPILNEDFNEWATTYGGDKFNFIHCDFPYGINADKHDQGNANARGGYEDSIDVYKKLLETFANRLGNFCDDSAHLIFWFSMEHYNLTFDALSDCGFKLLRHPLIWLKSDNSGILADPRRRPRHIYETALFGSRGDRLLVKPVADAVALPNTKSIHMSEKPIAMLEHFFRLVVDEYSLVLDPTCGSANSLKAAKNLGAQSVLGLELNKEFYKDSVLNWKEYEDGKET